MPKCTRCGRALKNPQFIEGASYGPICFGKMGGIAPTEHSSNTASSPASDGSPDQMSFFD